MIIRYQLNDQLRAFLKQPIGYLISGDDLVREIDKFDIVISVGDHVSASLIKQEIYPQLMIIDYKTKREGISKENEQLFSNLKGYDIIHGQNPAGVLTKNVIDAISNILKDISNRDKKMMVIDGEEDLIALPCILEAPSNATIIYGMPYKGVVIVPATEEYKDKVRLILSKM